MINFICKKRIFNSNKNTFTIINCFRKFKNVYLIARKSKKKLKFKEKLNNIKIINLLSLFKRKLDIKNTKILIISLSPYNFLISFLLFMLGVNKKNIFLFLRSDGYEEYRIKLGKLGYYFYGIMLGFLKKRINILSCSKSLTGVVKPELVFPSEITNVWLKNRKKQLKKLSPKKKINLLYVGRFRERKVTQI